LKFDRKELISSLERIAVLADQHNNVIKMSADNDSNIVKITTEAQDIGSGSESLSVVMNSESFQIAFNVRYLLEGIKVIDTSTVQLSCNSATTPAIFSPVDTNFNFIYLVMPIQIRN